MEALEQITVKRACRFTQAELARALRVATAAGMTVEVTPDGCIRIVPVHGAASKIDYKGQIRL